MFGKMVQDQVQQDAPGPGLGLVYLGNDNRACLQLTGKPWTKFIPKNLQTTETKPGLSFGSAASVLVAYAIKDYCSHIWAGLLWKFLILGPRIVSGLCQGGLEQKMWWARPSHLKRKQVRCPKIHENCALEKQLRLGLIWAKISKLSTNTNIHTSMFVYQYT